MWSFLTQSPHSWFTASHSGIQAVRLVCWARFGYRQSMRQQRYFFDNLDGDGLSPETSHPKYVAVAPNYFWSEDEDGSPFGNDSGNDTLRNLEQHFVAGGADGNAAGVIASQLIDWGLVPEGLWEGTQEEIVAWLDADDIHHSYILSEVNVFIAGACGYFKISGRIHPTLNFWAERATMLLEHVVDEWEAHTHGSELGRYSDYCRDVRAVIGAAEG